MKHWSIAFALLVSCGGYVGNDSAMEGQVADEFLGGQAGSPGVVLTDQVGVAGHAGQNGVAGQAGAPAEHCWGLVCRGDDQDVADCLGHDGVLWFCCVGDNCKKEYW